MEILEIVIYPVVFLLAWVSTVYIMKNKVENVLVDKKSGKFNVKMKKLPEKFSDEIADTSMKIELPDKNSQDVQKMDTKEIVKNLKIQEIGEKQEFFKFSKYIERSFVPDSNEQKRRIRFRLGLQSGIPEIFDVNIYAYFVITKIIRNENNIGWGSNWPQLVINKDYLPVLSGYWSINHNMDSNEYESPLAKSIVGDDIINLAIAVYAIGYLEDGKRVFGSKKYNWDKKTCLYGTAKLRAINEKDISDSAFDEIIPKTPEKGIWPNFRDNGNS